MVRTIQFKFKMSLHWGWNHKVINLYNHRKKVSDPLWSVLFEDKITGNLVNDTKPTYINQRLPLFIRNYKQTIIFGGGVILV